MGSEASQEWGNVFDIIGLQFVGCPPSKYGIWFYHDCIPSTVSLWLLLCLWTWGIFFLMGSSVLLYMAVQQLVVILVLSQEEMNACPSMPSSWTKSPTVSFYFIYPFVSLHYMSLALKSWVKVKVWQSTIDSFCLKQWECMWSHKDNT